MVRMACGVSGTTREIRGALAPFANSSSAKARRTTRTCCTPPLSNLASSFWSFGVTSILRGGRPIRQVCAKTILHKNGFLQYLQTVTDLEFIHYARDRANSGIGYGHGEAHLPERILSWL